MDFVELLRLLRRFRFLAAAVLVVVFALGVTTAILPPDRYSSTGTVLVEPGKTEGGDAVDVSLIDFVIPQLLARADSVSFRSSVRDQLAASVRSADVSISTSVQKGTGIINITAQSTDRLAVAPWVVGMANRLKEVTAGVGLYTIDDAALPDAPPDAPYAPARGFIITVSGVLAVLASLVAVGIAGALSARSDSVAEIRDRFGARVVGEIPTLPRRVNGLGPGELEWNPRAVYAIEALHTLRANVAFLLQERDQQWLAVTSTGPREGKTFISTELSWLFASLGQQTLLVDGDARQPSAHRRLGLMQRSGIADVEPGNLEMLVQGTDNNSLQFLSAGHTRRHPAEVVQNHLPALLEQVKDRLVIFDTPPLPRAAETLTYLSGAGAALLVISAKRRNLDEVEPVIAAINGRGVDLLGVVITHTRRRRRKYAYLPDVANS